MSINQELAIFLRTNFNGLVVKAPLFYNWTIGLRFNLQTSTPDKEEYFDEVIKRATTLFAETSDSTDKLFILLIQFRWKRRKIRFGNYFFKQITELNREEVNYKRLNRLYEKNDVDDIWNVATIKTTVDRFNYRKTFAAIANADFGTRRPIFEGQVFLINIDKKIIFNMYDDRGLDIISTDKGSLKSLYKSFDSWLLDYDRDEMKKRFE